MFNPFSYQHPAIMNVPLDLVLDFESKLYIGCVQGSQNYRQYGITTIISACSEQQLYFDNSVDHIIITVNDRPQADILQFFNDTNKMIDEKMQNNENILVHCAVGKSRSASLVLAYLMYSQKWSLQQALVYLRGIRPLVKPNPGFIKQLLQFEKQLYGKITSNLTHEMTPYCTIQQQDYNYAPEGATNKQQEYNADHYKQRQLNAYQSSMNPCQMSNRRASIYQSPPHFCQPSNRPYLQENVNAFSYSYPVRFH